ncbi:MAG TPA: thioesterase domain-containing protein [Candidatus Xenobia bacterium]
MGRLLFYARGSHGDVLPSLRLAQAMQDRGHQVTVVSHVTFAEACRDRGLELVPLDTATEAHAYQQDHPMLQTPATVLSFMRRHIVPRLEADTKLLGRGADLLVTTSIFDLPARLASELYRVPLLWLYGAPGLVPPPGALEVLYGSLLSADIQAARQAVDLPTLSDWSNWCRSDVPPLGAWPAWFDTVPGVQPIGFLQDPPAEVKVPAEADILVSAGTGRYLGDDLHRAALNATEALGLSAVAVTRHPDLLPHPLPAGVMVLPWRSFDPSISTFQAVLHHGGIGITADCLRAGVPQLVLAAGADRPQNGRAIEKLGVGRFLPQAQWGRAQQTLAELLKTPELRPRCQEMQQKVDPSAALETACRQMEQRLVRPLSAARLALAAQLVQARAVSPAMPPVAVQISSPGNGRAVHLVLPVGAHPLAFRELHQRLSDSATVYLLEGVEIRRPDGLLNVTAIALRFLEEVRSHGSGPYRLVGWSTGGNVAFLLAHMLLAEGRGVEQLALLESYLPGHPRLRPWPQVLAAAISHLRSVPVTRVAGEVQRRLRVRSKRLMRRAMHLPTDEYRPYPGTIDFFQAIDKSPWHAADPTGGWETLAPGRVRSYRVAGDHVSFLRKPHVDHIADVLLGGPA